ncbi:MAG: hypothetical protein Q8P15_02050 [Nanoarchaeota archaeon]|nr:hypothetical protein [Nanoarchaeota archaeon]
MNECFKCGVQGNKARLFDVILENGIVQVCHECALNEDLPIIKKPTTFQLKESEKEPLRFRDYVKQFEKKKIVENDLLKKQETTLKDILDRNVKIKIQEGVKPRVDLIDNFHWVIMRARRAKKLTPEQLAKEIGESETAIKLAEKGTFPDDDYRLVNKLENFLRIRIIKTEVAEELKKQPKRLSFDTDVTKMLTIADLQEMKKKRKIMEEDIPEFTGENLPPEEKEKYDEDRELTPEEVEDIIYGRR